MQKVIIDTDIGSDIDDALALGFLGRCGGVELLGVTTVFYKTYTKAMLAGMILDKLNLTVPVIPGFGKTMQLSSSEFKKREKAYFRNQFKALEGAFVENIPEKKDVLIFLKDTFDKYPGQVTLLAIGPLTNIALLIKKYPASAGKIKEIVMMSGCVYAAYPEWNIKNDYPAADIVFNSGIPIKMLPLEVTMKSKLEEKYIKQLECSKKPLPILLAKLTRLWQAGKKVAPTLHDLLAVMAITHPKIMKLEPYRIDIETKGEFTKGMTVISEANWEENWKLKDLKKANVRLATEIQYQKVIEIFMEKVLR